MDALHLSATEVVDAADPLRPPGTEGAVVSIVHLTVTVALLVPLAVAKTAKVWFPAARPV